MAYVNPFWYNRDNSSDSKYEYDYNLINYKPIYGSSVSYESRLNILETVDNSLKILPASENNLIIKYSLKFLLKENEVGNLLKTIEIAAGYKYLKFYDPSNLYKDFVGLAEDYSINKISNNLNEFNLNVMAYFKAPLFNWRTSSLFNIESDNDYSPLKSYKKHDFVYYDDGNSKNKIDNFWFAKEDIEIPTQKLNKQLWTKSFIHETKIPFEISNKFDIYQTNYKNSYVENIKHKDNSNSLKKVNIKFDNVTDKECLSILFFLEKKCGYRRFIYDFPMFFKKAKVFICIQWNHVFKYKNCNEITLTLVEDPNPNVNISEINGTYNDVLFLDKFTGVINNLFYLDGEVSTGEWNGKFYKNGIEYMGFSSDEPYLFYKNGVVADGEIFYQNKYYYFVNGKKIEEGVFNNIYYKQGERATGYYNEIYYVDGIVANGLYNQKYYINGHLTDGEFESILYQDGSAFSGIFEGKYYEYGKPATAKIVLDRWTSYESEVFYINGYLANGLFDGVFYVDGKISTASVDNRYYKDGLLVNGLYKYNGVDYAYIKNGIFATGIYDDKFYLNGFLANGLYNDNYYVNGIKATGLSNGKYYKDGYLSTGIFNNILYINGIENVGFYEFDNFLFYNQNLFSGIHNDINYLNGKYANGGFLINGVYYLNGPIDNSGNLYYDSESQLYYLYGRLANGMGNNSDLYFENGKFIKIIRHSNEYFIYGRRVNIHILNNNESQTYGRWNYQYLFGLNEFGRREEKRSWILKFSPFKDQSNNEEYSIKDGENINFYVFGFDRNEFANKGYFNNLFYEQSILDVYGLETKAITPIKFYYEKFEYWKIPGGDDLQYYYDNGDDYDFNYAGINQDPYVFEKNAIKNEEINYSLVRFYLPDMGGLRYQVYDAAKYEIFGSNQLYHKYIYGEPFSDPSQWTFSLQNGILYRGNLPFFGLVRDDFRTDLPFADDYSNVTYYELGSPATNSIKTNKGWFFFHNGKILKDEFGVLISDTNPNAFKIININGLDYLIWYGFRCVSTGFFGKGKNDIAYYVDGVKANGYYDVTFPRNEGIGETVNILFYEGLPVI